MATHTRKHGTRVTSAPTPSERIAAIRQIVTECQYAVIDGQMVDLFSASAIVKVYDALSDENKVKFSSVSAQRMASIAFKLLK